MANAQAGSPVRPGNRASYYPGFFSSAVLFVFLGPNQYYASMKPDPMIPSAGKILVIDDNAIIQRTINFALRDSGYQVLMASEVSDGIKIIRHEKLDLVLVDLSFPLLPEDIGNLPQDGFYFIDWVRRTPDIHKPAIIIISTTEPGEYHARAAAAGVKCCLQKPLDKELLLAAVQSVLNEARATGSGNQR